MCNCFNDIWCLLDKLGSIVRYISVINPTFISRSILDDLELRNEKLIDDISMLTDLSVSKIEKSRLLAKAIDIRILLSAIKQSVVS